MRYLFHKLVALSFCLLACSPVGLAAMQKKNHSTRYFKQIRQLNKKSKPVLNYNQFLSQPDPITIKQLQKFSKLQAQKPSIQKYEQKCMGQWVPKIGGTSPLFAVLLASYFLIGQVTAQCNSPSAQKQLLKTQQLTRIRLQQELEILRIARLQLEQNRTEALNLFNKQKRAEKLRAEERNKQMIPAQNLQCKQKKVKQGEIKKQKIKQFSCSTKTEVAVTFTDKLHLSYCIKLLGMFCDEPLIMAALQGLEDKMLTTGQILLIKNELDSQYKKLLIDAVKKRYKSQVQELILPHAKVLRQKILNILLTEKEFSCARVVELTQKLIGYLGFVRDMLFMATEPATTVMKKREEVIKKSRQLLAKVANISTSQNSPAAIVKLFSQDDLEKGLSTDQITYAEGVNRLTELLLKGALGHYA